MGQLRRPADPPPAGEHEIAWPALQSIGVSTELLAGLDAEHEAMAAALGEARAAMTRLRRSAAAADAEAAQEAFDRLQAVTITHLEHEEAEIEPVYLAHQDGPEIKGDGQGLRQGVPGPRRPLLRLGHRRGDEGRWPRSPTDPGPVLTILSGIFGRGYRRDVAPVWRS